MGDKTYRHTLSLVLDGFTSQEGENWPLRLEVRLPYQKFNRNFPVLINDVHEIAEDGEYFYCIPSRIFSDLCKMRMEACADILRSWRNMPRHRRVAPNHISAAILMVYIMNLTMASPPRRRAFINMQRRDLENQAGNLYFLEEIDWSKLNVEALEDKDLEAILGKTFLNEFTAKSARSNLGRPRKALSAITASSPARHQVRFRAIASKAAESTQAQETFDIPEPEASILPRSQRLADSFFEGVLQEIWSVLPVARDTKSASYLSPSCDIERLHAGTFRHWPINDVITKASITLIKDLSSWDAKFEICFPSLKSLQEKEPNHKKFGQGWKALREREHYLNWLGEDEDRILVDEVRGKMLERFRRLRWIPKFVIGGHVWKTRGGEVELAVRGFDIA